MDFDEENYENPMDCIIEPNDKKGGLYIGDLASALNFMELKTKNIRAVITVADDMVSFDPMEINHLKIAAMDYIKFDITQYFEKTFEFIFENLKTCNVLIHCFRGISRSGAILISFIMKFFGWKFNQSLQFAKMKRKIKNLELKKSGKFCFYLCEFLSSKFNFFVFFSLCY